MADVTVVAASFRAVAGNPEDVFDANAASGYTPAKGDLVSVSGVDEINKCDADGTYKDPDGMVESIRETPLGAYRCTVRQRGIMEGFTGLTAGDTLYNSLTAGKIGDLKPSGGLIDIGTVVVSAAAAEKFKTTTTAMYELPDGGVYTKAATDNLTFGTAWTINTGAAVGIFYGVFLVEIDAAGTVTAKAPSADQVYTSAALALAALPEASAGKVGLASIVVGAGTGADWVADTDDMTAGSDCSSVAFADLTSSGVAYPVGKALNATQILLKL
jgi:hypothetical protein